MTDVTVVSLSKDTLGESPLWLPERGELVWLDLIEGVLHRLMLGNGELISISVQARQPLGAVVRTSHPDILLLGCRDGIGTLDIASGTWTAFLDIEPGRVGMCLNDMKVDRHARLWVGSYEETETDSVGALWLNRLCTLLRFSAIVVLLSQMGQPFLRMDRSFIFQTH